MPEKYVPSLSRGLHQAKGNQEDLCLNDTSGLSEREKIHLEYGRSRDMSKITMFPAKKTPGLFDMSQRLRVVVYCRVSTDGISQATSFELQRNYYIKFVRKQAQWKLMAMYSDEGITATSTEKRIGLLQMLEDAKAGKFDVIVVKNLSRLSRNLMDCMSIIYALRSLPNPVGIFFESENLYTLDKTADFTLQVLSLVAQEESHKKSEAMLASYFMRFSQGQYLVPDLLGYKKIGKNKITVDEEEAKTVQLAFMMYLAGYSLKTIAGTMTRLQRKTHVHISASGKKRGGEVKWSPSSVLSILVNERRCGDILAQKTVTESYLTHKAKKNTGILPSFYAEDQHVGIVNPEDFLLTQRLLAANKGGWSGQLPEMKIYTDGALKGFVTVVPCWRGYCAEDYNRAALRAYGMAEDDLAQMGGSIAKDRGQVILGTVGQPASEAQSFQYRTSIDSDDYTLFPDSPDIDLKEDNEEQLDAFAEQVRRIREKMNELKPDKKSFGTHDFTGVEKVSAELCALKEKVYFTIDRNGIAFNAFAKQKLSCAGDLAEYVEIAYNPIMQVLIVRASESCPDSIHWVCNSINSKSTMKRCSCRGFSNVLFDNMGWNMEYKYRIVGTVTMIDNAPALVFTLDKPIIIVPTQEKKTRKNTNPMTKKVTRKPLSELLEAGYAPEDIQMPNMPEVDLGNQTLNEKAKNATRSRAIYYDNLTSQTGSIKLADMGDEKYNPECIRQILQKGRKPEEGWHYLKGIVVFKENGFILCPQKINECFGEQLYSNKPTFRPAGKVSNPIPYGWTQSLSLPTKKTVEDAIHMLEQEIAV